MTFEETFFGPGNRLRWEAIKSGRLPPDTVQRLGPFLHQLEEKGDIVVLPRVLDDGRVRWYVLCSTARRARVAKDELRGFLGPSYSDFEGQPLRLNPDDPIDAAVQDRFGQNAFTLEIAEPVLFEAARLRLLLFVNIRKLRPARQASLFRSVGRVLRDFEYALLASDSQSASECIGELRSSGRLTTVNLTFLRIRLLAVLEKWTEILALPELSSILVIPRPRRVTQDLICAVYATELQQFKELSRVAEAVSYFRGKVFPRFADLYASGAGLAGFQVDVSFALASVADPTRLPLTDSLWTRYPANSFEAAYLRAIVALRVSKNESADSDLALQRAQGAFSAADVDTAFELASRLSPSFDAAALLLRCAREMGTLSAATVALEAVDRLNSESQTRIRQNVILKRILAEIEQAQTATRPASISSSENPGKVPDSWSEWLRRLTEPKPWRAAVSVAETASREWSFDEYVADPNLVHEVAELLLATRHSWAEASLRDSMPYILQFFLARGPDRRLRSIYEAVFLQIATDDQTSIAQLVTLMRLAEAIITLGVDPAMYRDLVTQLISAIETLASPLVATPALEILDMLVSLPCADPSARETLLLRVASVFLQHYRRIDRANWILLRRYSEELKLPEAVTVPPQSSEEDESRSLWTQLDDKIVALYSLRESVLNRVANVLHTLCPRTIIQSFHDTVGGSPALRQSAANADIFIIATAAAKHAATTFITDHRPKSRPTLYARSQGSAGLLQALAAYLSGTPVADSTIAT